MKKKILSILITIIALCTCLFMLTACGENEPPHMHVYDQQIVNDTFKASDATCEDKAEYYYSCTCGEKGAKTFENGEALGHSFTDYTYNEDAECEIDGTETAYCDHNCGEKDTKTKVGSALTHEYGDWISNNNGTHTKTCSHNNSHKETKNCNGGTATCQAKAVCIDCNSTYGNFANCAPDIEWIATETHHYHACLTNGCTEKLDNEKHTFDKNKKCTVCDYVTTDLMWTEISSDVFAIDGTNLFVKVPNTQTSFYFGDVIDVAEGATFKVYADVKGTIEITTYMSDIVVGDNTFYITVSNSGSIPKTYTTTVRRRPKYTVSFVTNGGTAVSNQIIEEDFYATEPTTTRAGYTFTGWDYDFSKFITNNTEIKANWTANTNTRFKVEYYLQNLEDDRYTLNTTYSYEDVGKTDTTITEKPKAIKHFTFNDGYADNLLSGNIDGNGTLVLRLYYTRDKYTVTFNGNGGTLVSGNASQTVKYGGSVAVPTFTKTGYTFDGYDKTNYTNISESFTITAKWNIITYTITYDLNGGMLLDGQNPTTYTIETDTIILSFPRKANYGFLGWYNGDKKIETVEKGDFGTLNLIAKWEDALIVSSNTVTGVRSSAKTTCYELVIPNTITRISAGAFSGCTVLKDLTLPFVGTSLTGTTNTHLAYIFDKSGSNSSIPNSLKTVVITGGLSIGEAAFVYCHSLTSVVIGGSVTSIGKNAFYNCTSLTSVTIGNSVTSIGEAAFVYCHSLTRVNYTGTIDEWAQIEFSMYSSNPLNNGAELYINNELATEINISTASKINFSAFVYCHSLTSVVIGNSVTSIGGNAFYNCTSLTSVVIGDSVTTISSHTFYNCTSLTSVTIGNSVTSIGEDAFYNCTSLTGVVIPDSVTSIGYHAFYSCSSLKNIYFNGDVNKWVEIEGLSNFMYLSSTLYINNVKPTEIVLDTATKITNNAFYGCSSLTSIVIPDSVTSIGDYAFSGCTSLTSIVIPDSVTSIGWDAFSACYSLTSVEIPNSVTSIGLYAFSMCSSLTSIVIPDSVASVASDVFLRCNSELYTVENNLEYIKANSNPYYILIGVTDSNLSTYQINTQTKYIGSYAFEDCSSLTSIEIPNSVTSIGRYAFEYCRSLTSVVIGNSITNIGKYAFNYCSSLIRVDYIGNIDQWVQIEFSSLSSNPLYYAEKLYINDQLVTEVNITTATKITPYAFVYCHSLTSVTIGNSVTSIGNGAFYGCSSLTSIVIPDSVTSIGWDAFSGCTSLTSVEIPNSVTSIGDSAFRYCSSLESIKYRGSQSQWQAITKGTAWNYDTGNYTITYNYKGE